jgi:Ice-binding-like
MKNKLLHLFMTIALVIIPTISFGQTAPDLGVASGFALFTGNGAFNEVGTSSTVTGNVGTNVGAFNAFPPGILINGTKYVPGSSVAVQAAADVVTAFGNFGANGAVLGTPLETYNTTGFIYAGTYHTIGAAVLNGDFTLDAQGDPNAIFIININGELTVGAGFNILLKNSASVCNIYWLINGAFSLGAGSVFRGTVIAHDAISLLDGASLFGRGLSVAGAITLSNNVVSISVSPNAAAGPDKVICKNENTQLGATAVAGSTYSWISVPAGFTSTAANPSVTPLVTTTYIVVETITATGCNNTNSVVVTVHPLPTTSLIYHNL